MMKSPRDNHQGNKRKSARPSPLSPSVQSRQIQEIRHLSQEITAATSKIERWMETMMRLSHAMEDKKGLQELIETLSKIKSKVDSKSNDSTEERKGNDPDKSATPHSNSEGKTSSKSSKTSGGEKEGEAADGHKPFSQDGDSLYDLINAPGMTKIVDNVMKVRQTRQQNRKRNQN